MASSRHMATSDSGSGAEKHAEDCGEFARKSAALFNPRTRIVWDAAANTSVIVLGTLDLKKKLRLTCAGHVAGELPGTSKHLHSDGGATTFTFASNERVVDTIDAFFTMFPTIPCVTVDVETNRRAYVPRIPKTTEKRCVALRMPDGLANAEAFVIASKTAEAMTTVLDKLVSSYDPGKPRVWSNRAFVN